MQSFLVRYAFPCDRCNRCRFSSQPHRDNPRGLEPLLDDGIIDAVIHPLKSGKEASVYFVAMGNAVRCAKVYKDANRRGFHKLATYQGCGARTVASMRALAP
jgi:RIO kinase 1